jgi:hypothetical protein
VFFDGISPNPFKVNPILGRREWLLELRNYLNSDPVLADLLIDGFYQWLLDTHPRFP